MHESLGRRDASRADPRLALVQRKLGKDDQMVPIDPTGRAAAAAIPSAGILEYAGAPHGLFVTEQGQLSEDLLEFLATS